MSKQLFGVRRLPDSIDEVKPMFHRTRIETSRTRAGRIVLSFLIILALGACATTKKGGSGAESSASGQAASPAAKPQSAPQAQKPAQPGAGGQGAAASSPSAKSAKSESAMEFPTQSGSADAAGTGTAAAGEDVARIRQQLDEEQARINKLREEQAEARQLAGADTANQAAPQDQGARPAPQSAQGQDVSSAPSPASAAATPSAAAGASRSPGASTQQAAAGDASRDAASPAQKPFEHSVYFDYDQTAIRDEYVAVVEGNAAWIRAHPSLRVEVQGNCDSRGSREYNLALGARRAETVKRALELAGADGSRIKTVSFGAEKPVASGNDEQSHAQNRRADIIY
jgi:peptidoglycan-associated lipoprotein